MNHHSTWAHPPRKPKPTHRIPVLFFAAIGTTLATMFAVLIIGGQ